MRCRIRPNIKFELHLSELCTRKIWVKIKKYLMDVFVGMIGRAH